jgi:AraC-like DNA-binding protein
VNVMYADMRRTSDPLLAIRVRRYLDAHADRNVSLDEVARALSVSVRRMTGEFKTHYRLTVHEYLTRRRLARAVRLLVDTDLKVQAIARLVGFGSEVTLYRQIRRLLDTTPGSIRTRPEQAACLVDTLLRIPAERPATLPAHPTADVPAHAVQERERAEPQRLSASRRAVPEMQVDLPEMQVVSCASPP